MKPFLFLFLLGSSILLSCNKNNHASLQENEETFVKGIYGNYLEFPNHAAFDNAIEEARRRTPAEQEIFEKGKQFVSMATRYRAFVKELDVIEYVKKDSTGFADLKKKYEASVFWPQPDLFEINVPDRAEGYVVNEAGLVKIGGKLMKLNYKNRVEYKNITLAALKDAEKELQPAENANYKVTLVPRAKDVFVNKEPTTESYPGFTWMNLTHGNPPEPQWGITTTDRRIQAANNRRFDIQLQIRSTRRSGVYMGYITAIVHGMEYALLTWRHVQATNVKINGRLALEAAPVGIGSTAWFYYANLHVPDWYYENDYAQEGRQIIVVSEKLMAHPDLANISGEVSSRYADIHNATGSGSASIIFNDNIGGTDFSQLGLNYYWNRATSGTSPFPGDPYPFLTVDATVAGIGFSINF